MLVQPQGRPTNFDKEQTNRQGAAWWPSSAGEEKKNSDCYAAAVEQTSLADLSFGLGSSAGAPVDCMHVRFSLVYINKVR